MELITNRIEYDETGMLQFNKPAVVIQVFVNIFGMYRPPLTLVAES